MKVDVTTPDDAVEEQAPEAEELHEDETHQDEDAADQKPDDAPVDEVLDAEYEKIGSKKRKKNDDVFSLADIEQAQEEAREAQERFVRLQAEWDNFRKRTAREREEEKVRACESLVEKLLPVVDDIERAIDHAAQSEHDSEFNQFVDGIKAMHTKFVDVLKRVGAEVIDPVGAEFDMNEHQAVAHIEDPDLPDSTVRDVYQKGYRMGGHVIRPAMVTVSKGGPAREAQPEGASQKDGSEADE